MRVNIKEIFLLLSFITLGTNSAICQLVSARNVGAFVPTLTADTVDVILNDQSFYGDSLCVTAVHGSSLFTVANCSSVIFVGDSEPGVDSCWYVVCDKDNPNFCDSAIFRVWIRENRSTLPLLDSNKVWYSCEWFAENPTCPITIWLGSDTIIYNKIYIQVNQSNPYCANWTPDTLNVGWIREDSSGRVYFLMNNIDAYNYCTQNDSTELLLYDFSLQVGDTIHYSNSYNIIDQISSVTIDGIQREMWTFLYGGACGIETSATSNAVVEGIGSNYGLLGPIWETFENGYILNGVTKDSTILYGAGADFLCLTIGISTIDRHPVKIYPNPTDNFCTLQLPNNTEVYSAAIFDITGSRVQTLFTDKLISTHNFSIENLSSGLYFIKVIAKSSNGSDVWITKIVKE